MHGKEIGEEKKGKSKKEKVWDYCRREMVRNWCMMSLWLMDLLRKEQGIGIGEK